jgi:FHA domain-containing protein
MTLTLTLRAVSLNDEPLSQPLTAHFGEAGGTIGRADENTLALPDPERHISRKQAAICMTEAGYVLRNIGSAYPVTVRGRSLARGESVLIEAHDQMRIGAYTLEVVGDGAERTCLPARHVAPGLPADRSASREPAAATGLAGQVSSQNPFADLFAASPPGPAAAPRRDAALRPPVRESAAFAPPAGIARDSKAIARPSADAPRILPDDFDPFAAPQRTAPAVEAPAPRGLFEDLLPPAQEDSIANWSSPGAEQLLERFVDGAPSTACPRDDMPAAAGAPVPDHTPVHAMAMTPPPVMRAAPPALAPAADIAPASPIEATRKMHVAGSAEALWQAFCDGAGIDPALAPGANADLMRIAGQLLRSAVDGILKLQAVRAAARNEMHAQMTVIRARDNNPLKFSPDGRQALEQLLQPPARGYVAGPVAMAAVLQDLVGHAIATMVGTRAALDGMLVRFTPAALEAKLADKSMLDSLLPMSRKARLWELYLQHHRAIHGEAHEDFDALFGKAFLVAYEEQVERLRREQSSDLRRT